MTDIGLNKIIVPVDFSECSENALKVAASLAKKTSSQLIIVHGFTVPIPVTESNFNVNEKLYEDFERQAREKLNLLPAKIPELNEVKTEFKFEVAFPVKAIVNACLAESADLVVMGTNGSSGMIDEVFGSTTTTLIKKSPCPVLVIPQNVQSLEIKKIAFAADFEEITDYSGLQNLRNFAAIFNAKIDIINVNPHPTQSNIKAAEQALGLHNYLADIKHDYLFSNEEDIEKGINRLIKYQSIDLLTLLPRKHPFFENLFKKSITKKMALHTKIPLLVIQG